jgi:hypothetical protein
MFMDKIFKNREKVELRTASEDFFPVAIGSDITPENWKIYIDEIKKWCDSHFSEYDIKNRLYFIYEDVFFNWHIVPNSETYNYLRTLFNCVFLINSRGKYYINEYWKDLVWRKPIVFCLKEEDAVKFRERGLQVEILDISALLPPPPKPEPPRSMVDPYFDPYDPSTWGDYEGDDEEDED